MSERFAAGVTFAIWIGLLNTGMNIHGGNSTFFGPAAPPNPALGWLLIVAAFLLPPMLWRGMRRL